MSGICGIVRLDDEAVRRDDLGRQVARLKHLGPDRVDTWVEGQVGLAHLMLRVTGEDSFDAQPLVDDRYTLVADLRLDNREQLAAAMSIAEPRLATMADSDLLLAAYRHWGAGCVDHLLGDFAFAMWDAVDRTITLAVDHMGQRHLFYHRSDEFFAFASEIKGLWALPAVPRDLDEARLVRMLLLEPPDDVGSTDYHGISYVPGGTVMTFAADGRMTTRRYWEPHAAPEHLGRDEAYYVQAYRSVLTEAVACRLRRTRGPAGLMMSGGFDSAAIAGLAGPIVTEQGRKLVAVASAMPADYTGPIRSARRWCEICRRDMPHLDLRYVTSDDVDAFSYMEQAFFTADNRHSPRLPVTQQIFAELAAAGARVVMDGHGGDYTLNPRGQGALLRLLGKGKLRRFAAEFRATKRHRRQSWRQAIVANLLASSMVSPWRQLLVRRRNHLPLFGPTLPLGREVIAQRGRQPWWAVFRTPRATPLEQIELALRRQQNGPAQPYAISAATHGMEFTQPFHDKRVVELGMAIPEELHARFGKTRHLARTALRDVYPVEFQDRLPGTDSLVPDFLSMVRRAEPRILDEIDRMERSGKLSTYFDFDRMRAMIVRRRPDQHDSGSELDAGQAMLTFITARYIDWFRGNNG